MAIGEERKKRVDNKRKMERRNEERENGRWRRWCQKIIKKNRTKRKSMKKKKEKQLTGKKRKRQTERNTKRLTKT